MQIYGIDLASEKFDVNFIDRNGQERHRIVKNTLSQIEKFIDSLPSEAMIVAEHTGVYGDMLLMVADLRGVSVCYVSGYEIKHTMGLSRGKSDELDAGRIREYGERYHDRLKPTHFPSEPLYRLKELYATRRLLVSQRKQLLSMLKGDEKRPIHTKEAVAVKKRMLEQFNTTIAQLEQSMADLINNDPELSKTAAIVQSIPGIGPVTSTQLIIKTDNFKRVSTAKKCATLAGISPWPNSTGKSNNGTHVSHMGDKELKTLLFMCASVAVRHFEKMRIYKIKKHDIEKKHMFLVLNNVANKLLKILYSMVHKGELYNPMYVPYDPRLKSTY